MMRKTIACAALLACLATGSAGVTCIYPRAPEHVPDGNTATQAEMIASMNEVKQFDEDITAYTVCLEREMKSLEDSGQFEPQRLLELHAMQDKKHNAAIDEDEVIAQQFNEQLRIFNARNKKQ